MEAITVKEILNWTGGSLRQGDKNAVIRSISTDTRRLVRKDFFIPISGENFDGHKFIAAAAARGAAGSLFSSGKFNSPHLASPQRGDENGEGGFILVEVADTRKALLEIARNYRRKFKIPTIGLTGSSGKTTTKELITQILSASYRVMANSGNFNNEIGLPLSLLNLSVDHQVAVLEMGMNHPGEIAALSRVASPDFGLITNIGSAHLGFFRSHSRIASAKAELLLYLKHGCAVLPDDDRFFSFFSSFPVRERVTFGLKPDADYFPKKVKFVPEGVRFLLCRKKGEPLPLFVPLHGFFNLKNVLAAAALTLRFGIAEEVLARQLARFNPADHRFQISKRGGACIVDDTYNANPTSFRAALVAFQHLAKDKRKVVVVGSMAELGRFSRRSHFSLGRFLARLNPDCLILLGPYREAVKEGALSSGFTKKKVLTADDNQAAGYLLKKNLRPGTFAFLKGSHFLKMEEILKF